MRYATSNERRYPNGIPASAPMISTKHLFNHRNLRRAMLRVIHDKGKASIDGTTVGPLGHLWIKEGSVAEVATCHCKYIPSSVRRGEVPEARGGARAPDYSHCTGSHDSGGNSPGSRCGDGRSVSPMVVSPSSKAIEMRLQHGFPNSHTERRPRSRKSTPCSQARDP